MPVRYLCGGDEKDMTAAVLAACGEQNIPVPISTESVDIESTQTPTVHVRLQCTAEQWCDFPCGAAADGDVKGIPVPAKEVTRWEEWQKHSDPLAGLKRLDTYSSWIFAGALALVVTLASGLVSDTDPGARETTAAKWVFGLAVVALGFSWVFNALVKAPSWGTLNRHSPEDHLRVFSEGLQRRRGLFAWAAGLLGVALALAAFIPLARHIEDRPGRPRVALTYAWPTDSNYQAQIHGQGLPPNTPIEVRIWKDATTGYPVERALVDEKGVGKASVDVPAGTLQPPFRVIGQWWEAGKDTPIQRADTVHFTITGAHRAGDTPARPPAARDSVSSSAGDSARDSTTTAADSAGA